MGWAANLNVKGIDLKQGDMLIDPKTHARYSIISLQLEGDAVLCGYDVGGESVVVGFEPEERIYIERRG